MAKAVFFPTLKVNSRENKLICNSYMSIDRSLKHSTSKQMYLFVLN